MSYKHTEIKNIGSGYLAHIHGMEVFSPNLEDLLCLIDLMNA